MTWIEELIDVYNLLGGRARYEDVYRLVESRRNMNLTAEWKATVRKTVEDHSSDSRNFRGTDYFYHIGKGHWGLRTITANITPTQKLEKLYINDNINDVDSEETTRTIREINQLNRNKKIVNQLKRHYDFKCQICSIQIKLFNGDKYIEVHHLKPLGEPHNGPDIIENMIVVCPNCHIQLDYKSLKISLENIAIKEPHIININFLNYQNS